MSYNFWFCLLAYYYMPLNLISLVLYTAEAVTLKGGVTEYFTKCWCLGSASSVSI